MKKNELRSKSANYKNKIIETMELPKDCVMGASILTIIGCMELTIENYKGIIEYSECQIKIAAKGYKICILGRHLLIQSYDKEEMKITGEIMDIKYVR